MYAIRLREQIHSLYFYTLPLCMYSVSEPYLMLVSVVLVVTVTWPTLRGWMVTEYTQSGNGHFLAYGIFYHDGKISPAW
jgi:hypothetical protein